MQLVWKYSNGNKENKIIFSRRTADNEGKSLQFSSLLLFSASLVFSQTHEIQNNHIYFCLLVCMHWAVGCVRK